MLGIRIIKKTGLYFIGNLSAKLMSALMLPVFAFYIQAEDLGYFDFTQTIMWIVIPVFFVAIWEGILRFLLNESDELKQKKIITTSSIFTIIIAFILGATIILYELIFTLENEWIEFIAIMFMLYAIAQIWQYYARALGKSNLYILSAILGTTINFISVILLIVIFKYGISGLFISYILGQISTFLIIESKINIIKNIKMVDFDAEILRKLLLFSAPLVLNLSSAWIFSGFGRVLITNNFGLEINGLYSFASKFAIIITMIGSVVTMAIIEEAIITAKTKGFDDEFTNVIGVIFKIFLGLGLLSIPTIKIFYYFIKDTDYYGSFSYAPGLILFSIFLTMASNVGAILQAIDKTRYQFITTLLGAIVTVIFSYSLIQLIHVYAVILGQLLGVLVMFITRYFLIKRYVDFRINFIPVLIMCIIFIMIVFISLYSPLIIDIIMLCLITGLICFLYINQLKSASTIVKAMFKKS